MIQKIDDRGRTVQIRKKTRCSWCDEDINVGDTAVVRKYVYDGIMCNERQHPECYKAMCDSSHEYLVEGWDPHLNERGVPLQ